MAPEIFKKHFPYGRSWDLYAFLTPMEKRCLLCDLPQLEDLVDWDELDREWQEGDWLMLLSYQPRFEKYFDWSRVERKPSVFWDILLCKQPQFADHCDFARLRSGQLRSILMKQPQLAGRADWSRLTPADREKLEKKGIEP